MRDYISKNFEFAFGQNSGVIDLNKDKFELPRFPINEKYGDIERFDFLIKLKPLEYKKISINFDYSYLVIAKSTVLKNEFKKIKETLFLDLKKIK